ncbi:MAG: hypothetical protein M3Q10_00515 [Chloroflexota bacterium]|nr:hypothetical protein [Chloroflexota bacterium]
MTPEPEFITDLDHPKMQAAIYEMETLIRARYPDAVFAVGYGYDPYGVYLDATVDVDDTDEVVEAYIDRLLELQLEQHLALHVIPLYTPERNAAILRAQGLTAEPIATGAS